jgi:hypothetical protein
MAVTAVIASFLGVSSAAVRPAEAVEGDICTAHYIGPGAAVLSDFDGQGNFVAPVIRGPTYGLVVRLTDDTDGNIEIHIDSETGSARITSKAEIVDFEEGVANVDHALVIPSVLSQAVDIIDPDDFNDADGNSLNNIHSWLTESGYTPWFSSTSPVVADSLCGGSEEDGWGFVDFECIEAGYFHIDMRTPDDTEETGLTYKFYCHGQAEKATIESLRSRVETQPTNVPPDAFGWTPVTVTVWDQFGDRINGVEVTFSTNNCQFRNFGSKYAPGPGGGTSATPISPAGGGTTVTANTDTDTIPDTDFLLNNPLEHAAGTAEVMLDCTLPGSTPGVANITAIVARPGSDIVLSVDVAVVGPTAVSGLTVTLDPDEVECGEVIKATAKAVDSTGAPVSPGTEVLFTTDTSSGIVGGAEGAQGGLTTVSGEVSVLIATDPGNPGIHTVIAYVINAAGTPSAQASATYECEGAVAPAAPTVAPPATGTGTITPPSTGDAGLATGSTSATLFVIAGAVAFILAGLASVRFARN